MQDKASSKPQIRVIPVTAEHWADIETLFGERGACGGCWCMTFRRTRKEFDANKGAGNRRALKKLVAADAPVGVLAFDGKTPVGWCAVAPESEFPVLLNSRNFSGLYGPKVWSVTCFFLAKGYRRRGISLELLKGAVKLAKSKGAKIVEGYPHEPPKDLPPPFVWTGIASTFRAAGFEEVERKSQYRPLMRKEIR